jgi:hypothetical protein
MSEIKADTLTGKTTAGDITITNGATTQKLQDGVISTYSLYDQQNTTIDISLNVSSVTDSSTGVFIINFSNPYAVAKEYVATFSHETWFDNSGTDDNVLAHHSESTTSALKFAHWENGTLRDTQYLANSLIGDLA